MSQKNEPVCIPAHDFDLDDLMKLQYDACENYPFHEAIWGTNTDENRCKAKTRLDTKWQQAENFHVVKCVDGSTGELMAWCIWEEIGKKSNRAEAVEEDAMTTCDWLDGSARELARAYLIPAVHKRWDIMQGRAYMLLTNLCTAPHCRNRGAARVLVEWGLEQAKHLGVPAYCEASDMGLSTYYKLGFKKVGTVETKINNELIDECDVMVTS